jgi:hypothetical protein
VLKAGRPPGPGEDLTGHSGENQIKHVGLQAITLGAFFLSSRRKKAALERTETPQKWPPTADAR